MGSTAAAVLERRTDEILTAYRATLHSTDSALLREEGSVDHYLTEARRVLAHVIAELHRGTYIPHGTDHLGTDSPDPGGPRTHPVESGRAATALFDAVLVVLMDEPESIRPRGAEAAVLFSLLHRQIVARHTARSVTHIGYLLERIRNAHNDERQRVARELHDEVAGHLGSALNWFELHEVYEQDCPELAREKLQAARTTVRESLSSLRDVMAGLRHRIDTASLRTALTQDLEGMGERAAEVRVTVTGDEAWLPPGAAEELFLIIREAQRNAVRHARAALVTVEVHVAPGEVRAAVEDDGVGFDLVATAPRGHGGMLSMRERAELLGGSVTVESQPGCGTRILVFVPLKGDASGDCT
ncbi:sensor histidine kinase [Streptomyces sp. TRM 70361]|uniref:sensor histidine kinase n=1 Tax=Streptomyces sp. TRM 70361 TaxID=3116553 RepID=UPI002E7C40F4|nr:sensor histidine kinase [Streptomyces sp. TRM 70361]MEE1940375.1 sensor histidine kinase [Streptomyces sp. TRM 70361]